MNEALNSNSIVIVIPVHCPQLVPNIFNNFLGLLKLTCKTVEVGLELCNLLGLVPLKAFIGGNPCFEIL